MKRYGYTRTPSQWADVALIVLVLVVLIAVLVYHGAAVTVFEDGSVTAFNVQVFCIPWEVCR